ncbi:MAG: NADH:flavin oxidoreductase/NADH oxidase [Rhizobiales bacterium]|nr:NADH:flavin oxidoreductase/NADH oxidase [Hyphomicrobiales bacterium]
MSSALFSPLTLAGCRLANRLVVSPMCQYSAVDGVAQQWHWIHTGALMMSGAGLVILEATAVEAAGRGTPVCLGLYDDAQEAALTRLVADMRRLSETRIGLQLSHAGRRAATRTIAERWRGEPLPADEGAWRPVAPSAIAYDDHWQQPEELDAAGLARIRRAFAASATRADRAGFDLLEIHAAHGYLLHNFLSPLTNRRTDRYGGSGAARMGFPLEVMAAVRDAWPVGKPLGVRVNSTDWHPEGSTLDDAVAFVAALKRIGVDYAVMSAGNIAPGARIPPASPGHQVPFAERIKQEVGLPVMAVGFIVEATQAEAIIATGSADMVALGRAFLDNPRWGWHAAAALGHEISYPSQYIRARPNNWTGFVKAHPDSTVVGTQQMDRPAAAQWDRPRGA